ncbi:GIY-YIG nuclease family protein [Silanimonas sp.]|uniref:GIY-YIG nuclease family protein n=1 Tax=Silanimonas sp. TaxID=1929290 RepID=UPI0022C1C653|nr:GIY-YIG nuclease family protein [Silanimonas sp.]
MTDAEHWFVYVLRCRGDRLYCGIAKDVEARFAEHRAGKGAKFTRAFPPEAIVATITVAGKAEALREERAFKALARVRKLEQVAEWSERRSNRDPTHAKTGARVGT